MNVELLKQIPNPNRISLEALKEDPSWRDCGKTKCRLVRIFSDEHHAYWRPNGNGYVDDSIGAGIWSLYDAYERTSHCGKEKKIMFHLIS
jgi:hypothetical protein